MRGIWVPSGGGGGSPDDVDVCSPAPEIRSWSPRSVGRHAACSSPSLPSRSLTAPRAAAASRALLLTLVLAIIPHPAADAAPSLATVHFGEGGGGAPDSAKVAAVRSVSACRRGERWERMTAAGHEQGRETVSAAAAVAAAAAAGGSGRVGLLVRLRGGARPKWGNPKTGRWNTYGVSAPLNPKP